MYCVATILEFAGVHYFTKVGSGERFGSEAGSGRGNQIHEISDDEVEEDTHNDDDGDDEWEDVEEWRHVNNHHRYVINRDIIDKLHDDDEDSHDERRRYVSGDLINNSVGPIIDPLNHNCVSIYNKSYGLAPSMSASCDNVPVLAVKMKYFYNF